MRLVESGQCELTINKFKNKPKRKFLWHNTLNCAIFLYCRADFRLTPEEQDIAYEFKAHVMRKIHSQNQNIKKELELHEKKVDLKKSQQAYKKQVENQQKSQTTLVNLTKVYEDKAKKGKLLTIDQQMDIILINL